MIPAFCLVACRWWLAEPGYLVSTSEEPAFAAATKKSTCCHSGYADFYRANFDGGERRII
ncbi:MAG: hypothetical protein EXS31_00185 [Pedosphaera sp.]|nr:hypothetical protein [Pedosphaera sp.]